jgi:hypothetical protein
MSLGYFYETNEGMTPDEASNIYRYVKEEIDKRLPMFPYNFSMSDGLLYLDHVSDDARQKTVALAHCKTTAQV